MEVSAIVPRLSRLDTHINRKTNQYNFLTIIRDHTTIISETVILAVQHIPMVGQPHHQKMAKPLSENIQLPSVDIPRFSFLILEVAVATWKAC